MYNLQMLQNIANPKMPAVRDPLEQAGALAQIQNSMTQGQLGQQQVQAGTDAQVQRQAAQVKQVKLQQILSQPNAIGPDGVPTKETLLAIGQIDPEHAAALQKAFGLDQSSQSEIALKKAQTENIPVDNARADKVFAETLANNKAMRDQAAANAKAAAEKPIEVPQGGAVLDPVTKQPIFTNPAKPPTEKSLQHVAVIDPRDKTQTPIYASFNAESGTFTDQSGNVIPNARPVPTLATMGDTAGLTDAAKQMLANQLLATGQIPNVGSGAAGVKQRTDIANRAAAGSSETPNLAASGANFKADSGSLAALQKNRDAVVAFENTAGKNLDLFLSKAKGIIDSGSPWINSPLRTVAQSGLGSGDLAAFNAARQVAINEIAKVTSNPGLSGQLSDSARHEVEAFIPANATLKQVYNVANVLKQDMKNRHDSYDQQLAEIKGRMSGTPVSTSAPKIGDVKKFANGKTGKWDGQGWVQQ